MKRAAIALAAALMAALLGRGTEPDGDMSAPVTSVVVAVSATAPTAEVVPTPIPTPAPEPSRTPTLTPAPSATATTPSPTPEVAASPTPAPSADRDALIAFYNSTDGANWIRNDNWLSDKPIGEWFGVGADDDGRVVVLGLQGNGLSGEIPPELGALLNLESLHLSGNQLTGYVPENLRPRPTRRRRRPNPFPAGEPRLYSRRPKPL